MDTLLLLHTVSPCAKSTYPNDEPHLTPQNVNVLPVIYSNRSNCIFVISTVFAQNYNNLTPASPRRERKLI